MAEPWIKSMCSHIPGSEEDMKSVSRSRGQQGVASGPTTLLCDLREKTHTGSVRKATAALSPAVSLPSFFF